MPPQTDRAGSSWVAAEPASLQGETNEVIDRVERRAAGRSDFSCSSRHVRFGALQLGYDGLLQHQIRP